MAVSWGESFDARFDNLSSDLYGRQFGNPLLSIRPWKTCYRLLSNVRAILIIMLIYIFVEINLLKLANHNCRSFYRQRVSYRRFIYNIQFFRARKKNGANPIHVSRDPVQCMQCNLTHMHGIWLKNAFKVWHESIKKLNTTYGRRWSALYFSLLNFFLSSKSTIWALIILYTGAV